MVSPILEEMAEEYKDRAVVTKLNVDNNPQTTIKFGIRNIPTVLYFKNGAVADKQVGAVPKSNLVSKLEALL
jgi:thioredoxin 1